jgi:hypothetical protein
MNLVERVKAILLTPKTEWPVIATEPGDPGYLFPNYVAILAAIPAVCGFIGSVIVGAPIIAALFGALIKYVLTFVVLYIVALIVDALAPTFGGQKNFSQALKVTAYSYTPSWLAGVFLLIPGLRFLAILGLYGLYLLYLGLPPLMKSPPEKAFVYAAAVVVCAIILSLLVGAVLFALIGIRIFA